MQASIITNIVQYLKYINIHIQQIVIMYIIIHLLLFINRKY